jgi:hypothetical protein
MTRLNKVMTFCGHSNALGFDIKGTIGKKLGTGNGLMAQLANKKQHEWEADWDKSANDIPMEIEEQEKGNFKRNLTLIHLDEKAILREKAQEALLSEIKNQLQHIKPDKEEGDIKKACLKLVRLHMVQSLTFQMDIFDKKPEMKSSLVTNHGILPLIVMLDSKNPVILNHVLRLITQVKVVKIIF